MAQKRNIYAVPKPVGRDYTEQEQQLANEIEYYNARYHRGERAEDDAYGHYRQVSNKYKGKPVTPAPPFFVRGNTHPDPVEYQKLLRQEAQHDRETGREEILKHMSLMDDRDTETHNAHMNRAQRIDMLKELIKKNDRLLKSGDIEESDNLEDRKKKTTKPKSKRTGNKFKKVLGIKNIAKTTKEVLEKKAKATETSAYRKKKTATKPKRKVVKKIVKK